MAAEGNIRPRPVVSARHSAGKQPRMVRRDNINSMLTQRVSGQWLVVSGQQSCSPLTTHHSPLTSTKASSGLKLPCRATDHFDMTRFTSFLTLAAFAAVLSFGAPRPEATTYVDGNLPNLTPNTGGTLLFSDDKAMYLRTGSETTPVAY